MATKKKLPVVSWSIAFSQDGKKYAGVSMPNGVGFGLKPAPCGVKREIIEFTNAKNPPLGLFFDGVSATDDKSVKVPEGYLLLKVEVPVPITAAQTALGF